MMVSPGLSTAAVGGLIGLRSGVRLHVDVFGAEELLGAVARQVLDDVGEFAAAVVALAGIAFGVLVGEDAAGGFEHRFGGEVLAGDQLELGVLALGFVLDGPSEGWNRGGHRNYQRTYLSLARVRAIVSVTLGESHSASSLVDEKHSLARGTRRRRRSRECARRSARGAWPL